MSQVSENRMQELLPRTTELVQADLGRVEQMLTQKLRSDVPVIDEMVNCGAVTGGKRFRPILLLLTASACGEVSERHIMLATSVEMIHAATLVHDDIIDKAEQRRHVSTINSRWGNQGAVLFGDFLFTQAFYLASLTGSAEACQIIGRATNRVCEGELQQSDAAGNFETEIEEYYDIISKKTAELCACATRLGACFANSNPSNGNGSRVEPLQEEQWSMVGNKLGMAFQIIDDILDYRGESETAGKTLGTDLETAKPTLPILLALRQESNEGRAAWTARLSRNECSREEVFQWLSDTGSMDECKAIARSMVDEAFEFTNAQDEVVATAFQELGHFLLRRSH